MTTMTTTPSPVLEQVSAQTIADRRRRWAEQALREPTLCGGYYAIADPSMGVTCCYTGVAVKVYAQDTNQTFTTPPDDYRHHNGSAPLVLNIRPHEYDVRRHFGLSLNDWDRLIKMNDASADVATMNAVMLAMDTADPAEVHPATDKDLPF